jgi:HPt (histidine-containing phosphotransfer) domain-containing protein
MTASCVGPLAPQTLPADSAETFADPALNRPLPGWQCDRPGGFEGRPCTVDKAAQPAGDTAIDIMGLLGRCLGNFELIVRVLAKFRKTGDADLEQLACAIDRSDFAAVVEIAHRFKGAAGNVSAAGLHKIAAGMEQFGREQNAAELPGSLSQLEVEWQRFLRFADAFAPAAGAAQVQPAV